MSWDIRYGQAKAGERKVTQVIRAVPLMEPVKERAAKPKYIYRERRNVYKYSQETIEAIKAEYAAQTKTRRLPRGTMKALSEKYGMPMNTLRNLLYSGLRDSERHLVRVKMEDEDTQGGEPWRSM